MLRQVAHLFPWIAAHRILDDLSWMYLWSNGKDQRLRFEQVVECIASTSSQ
jgi:hypothetical protein